MLIPRKYLPLVVVAFLLLLSLVVLSYSAVRLSETGFLRKMILEAAVPVEGAVNKTIRAVDDAWKRYIFLVGIEDENRRLQRQNAAVRE